MRLNGYINEHITCYFEQRIQSYHNIGKLGVSLTPHMRALHVYLKTTSHISLGVIYKLFKSVVLMKQLNRLHYEKSVQMLISY
jgi:hypothetical protein